MLYCQDVNSIDKSLTNETGIEVVNSKAARLTLFFGSLALFLAFFALSGCDQAPKKSANRDVEATSSSEASKESAETPVPEVHLVSSRYVPDRQCADCHEEIWKSYQKVGMAQSAYTFESNSPIEDFENAHFYHEPSRKHYEMKVEDGKFVMTRFRIGKDGQRIHVLEKSADLVIGSGNHSKTYAYREPSGDMFQMPVAWYSQSGKWAMAPGYDNAAHEDFGRQITRDCMFCHNAYPELDPAIENSLAPEIFPKKLPHGIGCQRCHGPGEEHCKAAEKDPQAADVLTTIVNPSKLPAQQSEDVCNQCHLQPTSKRTSFLRHFDRGAYSFRPGEKLADFQSYWDLFDADERDLFEVNHHAYRMHKSKCYTASNGALNCVSCHDPHKVVPKDEQVAHYRASCFQCHGNDDCLDVERGRQPNSNCVECHMPSRRSEDAIHVVMTDHKIARPSGDKDLLAELKETDFSATHPVNDYPWIRGSAKPDETKQKVGHTVMRVIDEDKSAFGTLLGQISSGKTVDDEPKGHLAKAMLEIGSGAEALDLLNGISVEGKQNSAVQSNIGLGLIQQQKFDLAAKILERAIKMEPVVPEAHFNLGIAYINTDRIDMAIKQFRRATELQSNLPKTFFYLASSLARNEQYDLAEVEFRHVLEVDPDYPGAAISLADMQGLQSKYMAAIATLENELYLKPKDAEIAQRLAMVSLEAVSASKASPKVSLAAAKKLFSLARTERNSRMIVAVALLQNGYYEKAIEAVGEIDTKTSDPLRILIAAVANSKLEKAEPAMKLYQSGMGKLDSKEVDKRLLDIVVPIAKATFTDSGSSEQ